jgi:hypothetical protein
MVAGPEDWRFDGGAMLDMTCSGIILILFPIKMMGDSDSQRGSRARWRIVRCGTVDAITSSKFPIRPWDIEERSFFRTPHT